MAPSRPKPPGSARAIAAYRCGARMAEWRDTRIPDMACRGENLKDFMTDAERQAFRLTKDAVWWRYWWQGYHYGVVERSP